MLHSLQALTKEFDMKREGKRLDIEKEWEKPRDEDGNLLDEEGIALKKYIDGNREKTAGTAFELMSPLEQEAFEKEKKEKIDKEIADALAVINVEEQTRYKEMVESRKGGAGDLEGGGSVEGGASIEKRVEEERKRLSGEFDISLTQLKETQEMEVRGVSYDEKDRINHVKREKRVLDNLGQVAIRTGGEEVAVARFDDEPDAISVANSVASFQRGSKSNPILPALDKVPFLAPLIEGDSRGSGDRDGDVVGGEGGEGDVGQKIEIEEIPPLLNEYGEVIEIVPPKPTEEELEEQEKILRQVEEQMQREKAKQLTAPVTLDLELLEGILDEVQDEVQSKLEQHEQTLRDLFSMWFPIMAKVKRLNGLVDDSRTVRAYEDYIKDREVVFNEVKRVKKQYIKKMERLKKAALKSEDFKVVYIATNEVKA